MVAQLHPKGGSFFIMYLSRRRGIYYLWYVNDDGKKQKVSTGATRKSEALKFLTQFNQRNHERKQSIAKVGLSDFSKAYIEYAKSVLSPNSIHSIKAAFNWLSGMYGDIQLADIHAREVDAFVSDIRRKGRSDRTVRCYFVTLASAFQTAVRWNHIEENPFRKTDKPKLRELLPLYFSKEEFLRVLNCETDGDLRDLYVFAVFTGMRLGETMALQWGDVDIERKLILVRNSETFTTKSGRVRRVPMNGDVVRILRAREAAHAGPTVFTFIGGRLTKDIASRHFKTCVLKAGVNPKLHFHSLRHTFATWLVQAEAPIFEVQRLLGHSSIEMTQIYAHGPRANCTARLSAFP